MSSTSYNYSVFNDFPKHNVDTTTLQQALVEQIGTSVESVVVIGDVCTVTFVDALSSSDKDVLDTIVAANQGNPNLAVYSIQNDFPNHIVSLDRLTQEIQQSAITVALDNINTSGDVCSILFKDEINDTNKTALDAVVASHSGESLPESGRQAVKVQPFAKTGREYSVVGRRFVATLDTTTDMDITFNEEREIQGASTYMANVTDGDYVEFFAMLPDGQGGYIQLLQWGETIYSKEKVREDYYSEDARTIPAGIVLRLVYHSTATTGDSPVVKIELETWK